MKNLLRFTLLLALIFIADQAFGQGCSQCKMMADQTSASGDIEAASYGSNFNAAILYLMAIPYILLLLFFRKKIISGFRNLIGK